MTDALPRDAVLLVVDVQNGFDRFNEELHRNNPALEANIARLQRAWRSTLVIQRASIAASACQRLLPMTRILIHRSCAAASGMAVGKLAEAGSGLEGSKRRQQGSTFRTPRLSNRS